MHIGNGSILELMNCDTCTFFCLTAKRSRDTFSSQRWLADFLWLRFAMSDHLFIFWIVLAALLLLLLVFAAVTNYRRSRLSATVPDSIVPHLVPLDLEEVLIQLDRSTQSPENLRNAVTYLRQMARNAALLQRLGYSQVNSGNTLIASLAQQLVTAGVNVRLYAFMGLGKLYFARIFGAHSISPADSLSADVLDAYELLRASAVNLAALKYSSWQDALTQGL